MNTLCKDLVIGHCSNGYINIQEDEWSYLNATFDKETIKQSVSDAIVSQDIKLPIRELSKECAISSFNELCELDTDSICRSDSFFTRYEYSDKYPLGSTIISCSNVGSKASDYFHQNNRWRCDSINSPSPYRTWESDKFRMTLLNALWSLKVKKVDSVTLRTCIGLRKYIASQFRPSAAKFIYNYFNATNVLDMSMGWGDRLCGFMASDALSYTGIDPNSNLFDGYVEQTKLANTQKNYTFINGCAEDVTLTGMYDLIFTSPPYFNIERYTQENNQSFKKFKKIGHWLDGFLFKSIANAWEHLEVGGHMVINISDVYSNHTVNNICDPMNDFISGLEGSQYVDCWCYEMRKRPNSGAVKGREGSFGEPVWIWKKTK